MNIVEKYGLVVYDTNHLVPKDGVLPFDCKEVDFPEPSESVYRRQVIGASRLFLRKFRTREQTRVTFTSLGFTDESIEKELSYIYEEATKDELEQEYLQNVSLFYGYGFMKDPNNPHKDFSEFEEYAGSFRFEEYVRSFQKEAEEKI